MAGVAVLLYFLAPFLFLVATVKSSTNFYIVWASSLLSLVFLVDDALRQESWLDSIITGTLCVIILAFFVRLSPIWDFFAPDNASRPCKPMEVISPDSDPIVVDIVAVHGLGSSPETAWAYRHEILENKKTSNSATPESKEKRTVGLSWLRDVFLRMTTPKPKPKEAFGPMWLREYLPQDTSGARILVFYHNSQWETHASTMSLEGYGQQLLQALDERRQLDKERNRPIMFIGYSFGGLIVKKAAVAAGDEKGQSDLPRRKIPACVKGFIFLGTPHEGSELSVMGKVLSFLGYWKGSSTKLLEVTFPGSQENHYLHKGFMDKYREVEMVNFYETQKERMGPFDLDIVVSKEFATITDKPEVACDCKHRELHRFWSKEDTVYKALRFHIGRLVGLLPESRIAATLKWLSKLCDEVDSEFLRLRQAKPKMINEVTDWFLQSPEFKAWSVSEKAEILWYAEPPSSKRTERALSSMQGLKDGSLHDSVQGRVAFFFSCSRAGHSRPQKYQPLASTTIVLAILAQLLDHKILNDVEPELQKHLYDECQAFDTQHNKNKEALWKILDGVMQHILSQRVNELQIIIDGIDDMLTHERDAFLRDLRGLWETTAKAHWRLKILIVSRPYNLDVLDGLPFANPEKEASDCLNSLGSGAQNDRRTLVDPGDKGTGAWLWKDDDYMQWYDSPEGAFLWIQGKPGSGKSTLCKKIYERLKTQHNLMDFDALDQTTKSGAPMPNPPKGDTVLASFFFSLRGAKTETSNTQMLQSLLYQILYQQRWLYPFFRDSYRALRPRAENREATVAWNFEALHTVFRNLAKVTLPDQRLEIYLLVDALDESEKEERDRVLALLQDIGRKQTPPTSCVFKCVLASRPEEDIKSSIIKNRTSHLILEDKNKGDIQSSNVGNAISHLILEDKNKDDIKTVIEVKLKLLRDSATDSPKTSETQSAAARPEDTELGELLKFAAGYLESKAQGVFIWVEIATRELEKLFAKGYTPGRVKEILKRFPVELGPFYKRIANDLINRFKESNTLEESLQEARRVLTWTTFAERPLSISEFRDAFAIPDSVEGILIQDFKDQRLGNDKAVELRMAGVCGDLVEIRHDIIQLLHLTVREFLLRDQSATQSSMEVTQGELDITVREFLLRDQSATQSSLEVTRGEFDMTVREFLLLNQSTTQFSMRVAQGELYISLACIRYLQVVFTQLPPIANPDPKRFVRFLSKWHLLSYILRFLPRHLRNTGDRREEAHRAGAEFADAITCENRSACWLLDAWFVKAGLRQQSHGHPDNFILNCITVAARGHLLDTAFALLETVNENTGADVDDEDVDKRYGDILLGVSRIGVYQLIRPLLEMGADLNYNGRDGDTPLIVASMGNDPEIVHELLRAGARPNVQGKNGTPLLAAVTGGARDIVQLLLEAGADPNSGLGVDGASTPLLAASTKGDSDIVKILLMKGADPNSGLGVDGASTPLFKASAAGHELIVEVLLDFGANLNIPSCDPDGSGDLLTPLQAAEAAGHMEIAKMLRNAEATGRGKDP